MKLKVVCKKVYDYIRYDLKEIAFPSSLPDPPHIKKRLKLTCHERYLRNETNEKEPSVLEDLAVAARGGMETLRPALQKVYMTRAYAYKDALKSFIEGYQDGVQQVMGKTEDKKNEQEADLTRKST
ncbi:hypothetical protein CFOL_v3_32524 [Cephalotus follicularis]|uniref:Uncharacterized protein n=1 Tax=Cephalotus follicularis TaxID=3775 RepID=A0A1Q3D9F5_CEPFO|nr:hypothetical protein CFOL_v3_32524 [Cephalotus follicularis]